MTLFYQELQTIIDILLKDDYDFTELSCPPSIFEAYIIDLKLSQLDWNAERIIIIFKNPRYLTRGVAAEIPVKVQLFLWLLIDCINGQADYLQVFKLSPRNGKQQIIHTQEKPPFSAEYDIPLSRDEALITASLFVIDDSDHTTMLLASEY